MQVKSFHKSHCSRLAVVGNLCGRRSAEVKSRKGVSSYIYICVCVCVCVCVFHLRYQIFDGISICNIRNKDGV